MTPSYLLRYRSGEPPPPLPTAAAVAAAATAAPAASPAEKADADEGRAAGDSLLMAGAVNARHKLEIACYRQQLLMAYQGEMSEPIKKALQGVLDFQNEATTDDEELPSPPPAE